MGNNQLLSCRICNVDLATLEEPYMIEHAYHRPLGTSDHKEIYGYALCMSCGQSMGNYVSVESKKFMEEWSKELIVKLQDEDFQDYDGNYCIVSGQLISECDEYMVASTYFQGQRIEGSPQMSLSWQAIEQLQNNLSKETKDFFDSFLDTYVDLPPDFKIKPVPIL